LKVLKKFFVLLLFIAPLAAAQRSGPALLAKIRAIRAINDHSPSKLRAWFCAATL